jgi:hypothetical protein
MPTPILTTKTAPATRHHGPNLGAVAIVFTLSKLASLFPVTIFEIAVGSKAPYFPPETASTEGVVSYFATHSTVVLVLAFLQFGSKFRWKSSAG